MNQSKKQSKQKRSVTEVPDQAYRRMMSRRLRNNTGTPQQVSNMRALRPPNKSRLLTTGLQSKSGAALIHKMEYIGDVYGTINFNIDQSLGINPGLVASFPWLAQVASSWEVYSFRLLKYHYKPTSGSAVSTTNPALGVIIMATQYNALDAPFATKQQMENYQGAMSTVPYIGAVHDVLAGLNRINRLSLSDLYVRVTTPPVGADARLYDLGTFSLATQGMPADGNPVGELWVEYMVELIKPRLTPPEELVTSAFHAWGQCFAGADPFTGILGTLGNLPYLIVGGNSFIFPTVEGAVTLLVAVSFFGSVTVPFDGVTPVGGALIPNSWTNFALPFVVGTDGVTAETVSFILSITGPNQGFAAAGPTIAAATYWDVYATGYPSSFITP